MLLIPISKTTSLISTAVFAIAYFILKFLGYKEEPEIAPSRAQYRKILQRRGQLLNEKVKDEESNAGM